MKTLNADLTIRRYCCMCSKGLSFIPPLRAVLNESTGEFYSVWWCIRSVDTLSLCHGFSIAAMLHSLYASRTECSNSELDLIMTGGRGK